MKKRDMIFGLVTGILGLVLAVGSQTFARPCVHADGSAAICAPIQTWLTAEGGIIAVLAGISMLRGHAAGTFLTAACGLLAALTPGVLVPICKLDTMACRQVTQPTALVTGILTAAAGCWWTVLILREKKQEARS